MVGAANNAEAERTCKSITSVCEANQEMTPNGI
jgi:hypothetical protein